MLFYAALVLATGFERLAELVVSSRNARWSFTRGGVEFGRGHFPFMVFLHTGMLLACVLEVFLLERPFLPLLGWPMLVVALASQALRWWCIGTLGPRWNTRVIVVPGLPLVSAGPYRVFRHPNYIAVIAEGIALPLVHTAWITALVFTTVNLVLLFAYRIPVEERALSFGLGTVTATPSGAPTPAAPAVPAVTLGPAPAPAPVVTRAAAPAPAPASAVTLGPAPAPASAVTRGAAPAPAPEA